MIIKDFLIKLQAEFDNKSKPEYLAFFVEKFECEKGNSLENLLFISNDQKDYFVFIEQNAGTLEHSSISELQRKLQVYTRKNFPEGDFISDHYERNSTLIIFVRSDYEIVSDSTVKMIMDIEEDPYLFKKQVVFLNKQEIESLERELLVADSIEDKCKKVIEDIDAFLNFKNELKNNEIQQSALYSLVTKLYEKIPFLTFDVVKKDYQNLSEEINKILKERNVLDLKNTLLSLDFNLESYIEGQLEKDEKEDINEQV
ncbi:hypothetical protein MMG00_00620 [Ignatzschineria rhizosphaerae]|uniref:Uncharacterized protein n=1 Tax=Ignatzschineria rhizosphaerae TaxID=2923279 RepID=A0ABY3X5U0_9GAMM|nr:ABC-three component system middle component 1 [Ignatzschineria rhizosphaerae]UNM96412.1 hypothetical protein MMG00_00620 [Ignatzschineria rhizosphaerae]